MTRIAAMSVRMKTAGKKIMPKDSFPFSSRGLLPLTSLGCSISNGLCSKGTGISGASPNYVIAVSLMGPYYTAVRDYSMDLLVLWYTGGLDKDGAAIGTGPGPATSVTRVTTHVFTIIGALTPLAFESFVRVSANSFFGFSARDLVKWVHSRYGFQPGDLLLS